MTRWARLKRRWRRAKGTSDRMPALRELRGYVKSQLRREVIPNGEEEVEGQGAPEAHGRAVLTAEAPGATSPAASGALR